VSGAHLNPAVTVGFAVAGRFPLREVVPYVLAQCAGAFLASGVLDLAIPDSPERVALGATLPAGTALQSFVFEALLTLLLMFVALSVATGAKERGLMAGVAVGAVVALEALFAGPVCGASMNPARSLAPAVVSGHLEHLWVYLAAPTLGACFAVGVCGCVHDAGCCAHSKKECQP
jgi:aquaporin Z